MRSTTCPGKGRARTALLAGAAATIVCFAGSADLAASRETERTISFYNFHNKETTTITYKRDGKYIPEAMEKVNWAMRDWRRNEPTKMDPKLVDLLWEIHRELGSRKPITLVSGYRSRKTNNWLRRNVGGQARNSRHILGKAADVHFPDIPTRQLRYAALIRERGGVGYYPTSAIPFVHVDTGRVRHWPRMGRDELALLFPNGRTKHRPRGNRAITKRDVVAARRRRAKLASAIDAFYRMRKARKSAPSYMIASAGPAPTSPAHAAPKPASSGAGIKLPKPIIPDVAALTGRPGAGTAPRRKSLTRTPPRAGGGGHVRKPVRIARASLGVPLEQMFRGEKDLRIPSAKPARTTRVAYTDPETALAGTPSYGFSSDKQPRTLNAAFTSLTGWVHAPDYDPEHPGELAYRPFPIAPLLTKNPSVDDPHLSKLVHPDVARIRELLDNPDSRLALRFRPGLQMAEMTWSDLFTDGTVTNDLIAFSSSDKSTRVKTAASY